MTQENKKMTVDEAVNTLVGILNDVLFVDDWHGKEAIKQLIEAQRAQAVEEYKQQNPPVGWLPITDGQKNGAYYPVGCYNVFGEWVKDYLRFSALAEDWSNGCCTIDITPTHYLPIDQIPLPDKEQG